MKLGPFNINILRGAESNGSNPNLKVQKDVEIGVSGTSVYNGFISDTDYVPELTGSRAIETYDSMRKSDGVVKAALLACELPIRSANWYIESFSDDEKDKEVADFVYECLFNKMTITWDDFLRQALLCLPFGFMVFEKVFTVVNYEGKNMIGWRKFAPRLPLSIAKWTTKEGEDGITQMSNSGEETSIPIDKLLIFTHDKEGDNWNGTSVLRSAYRPWFFKEHIEKINAIVFERQGLGIPYVKLPKNATAQDRSMADELLENMRANEEARLIEPGGDWEIGFKDTKSTQLKDPDLSIKRYNREILISVLAQFLDLGSESGSRSLSEDHSSTFHNNLISIAHLIRDNINKYAIKQLVDLNFNTDRYPTLEFSHIGVTNYSDIATSLSSLIEKGAINPDKKLEVYLRNLMSLPEIEEVENKEDVEVEKKKEEDVVEKASERFVFREFKPKRKLTFAEQKVDFQDIQNKMDYEEEKLRNILLKILNWSGNDLIRQMQIVLDTPSSTEKRERLQEMSVKYKGDYRKEIIDSIKKMFEYGKILAAKEMKKEPPTTPADSTQDISKLADGLTAIMADGLLKAGKLAFLMGLQQNKSKTEILSLIKNAIKKEEKSIAVNSAATNIGSAFNQGRRTTLEAYQDDIYALQRSEVLDHVTCNYCMSIDSRVFRKRDSFTKTNLIHSNCRGMWVEVLKTEEPKPKITGIPKSLRERFQTINVFEPPKSPIIRKDSPAAEFLK